MADFLNLKMGEKVFLPKKTETAVKEIATLAPSNSLPLAFTLHDKDKHAVVYLENPAILKSRMVLTVTNSAAHQISFNPLNGNKASANAFHFALHFRPGTISEASVVLGSQPSGWSLQTETRGDGSYWIYVLSTTARTLNPQDSLSFDLQKLLATPELGARGARVALVYRNLVFTGEQTPLKGTRTQHLSLVHRGVNADLPVHLGFVGSNTILNAGNATNSLTLRLTNLSNTDIIFQMPEDSGRIAPTKLILSFDATGEWALGDLSEINAIDPKIQGWVRQVEEQGLSPRWIFTPQSQKTLAAQSAIEILIGNIRSSKPAGLSNLHLQYENLPDYTDGHLVAAIQKTALVERNGTMEFGGTEFKINAPLRVQGQVQMLHGIFVQGEAMFMGQTGFQDKIVMQGDLNIAGELQGHAKDKLVEEWNKAIHDYLPIGSAVLHEYSSKRMEYNSNQNTYVPVDSQPTYNDPPTGWAWCNGLGLTPNLWSAGGLLKCIVKKKVPIMPQFPSFGTVEEPFEVEYSYMIKQ